MKDNTQQTVVSIKDTNFLSFAERQLLSKETVQQEDLAVLVIERKSSFEISIAKTKQSIAAKNRDFQTFLRDGNPVKIVETASEIESLEKGLELLEKYYKILFPA